jgi:hypothetical protein
MADLEWHKKKVKEELSSLKLSLDLRPGPKPPLPDDESHTL